MGSGAGPEDGGVHTGPHRTETTYGDNQGWDVLVDYSKIVKLGKGTSSGLNCEALWVPLEVCCSSILTRR